MPFYLLLSSFKNATFIDVILEEENISHADFEGVGGLTQQQVNKFFYCDGKLSPKLPEGLHPPEKHPRIHSPEKEKPVVAEFCVSHTNDDKWEIYKDGAGEWRWKRISINIVGSSHQGYENKADCIANAKRHCMDCKPSRIE